jgi:PAS domain-containing protein
MATPKIRQLFADGSPFRTLFDAMSALVFIVDDRLVVHDANLAAERALGPEAALVLKRLCGDVLRCLNSGVDPKAGEAGPCGDTVHCNECVLRKSTAAALAGGPTARRPYSMRLLVGSAQRETYFVVNATPFEYSGQRYVMLVLEDVTELHELRKIVPICAWCHKVYVSGEYHAGLEQRLREQALIDYTHGICPACAAQHFPDLTIDPNPAK